MAKDMHRGHVVCCYISHHPTVLSPLSRLRCDNRKLVYFLVNLSRLYVLSRKFISRITLTFRSNLTILAEYIVLCGVSHLVINFIWGFTRIWCFISRITLVVDSNLLCHTLSFVASLLKFWRLGSVNLRESTYRRDEFTRKYTSFWLSHVTREMMGRKVWPLRLTNKLGVTSEINSLSAMDGRDRPL